MRHRFHTCHQENHGQHILHGMLNRYIHGYVILKSTNLEAVYTAECGKLYVYPYFKVGNQRDLLMVLINNYLTPQANYLLILY